MDGDQGIDPDDTHPYDRTFLLQSSRIYRQENNGRVRCAVWLPISDTNIYEILWAI